MYRRLVLITCLVLPLLVAACGQKGPLYLPDPEPSEPKQEARADESENEKKKPGP